jgi:dienelactone hydrolase
MAGVRPDAAYRVGQLQQRQARERGETPPEAPHTTIEGYLSKPDGSGPFPAVVYVHGCSGLSTDTRKRMAERLTAWGYISFVVDSLPAVASRNPAINLG